MTVAAQDLEKRGLEQYEQGDLEEALESFQAALERYSEDGDQAGVVEMWNDLGVVRYRQRLWDHAQEAFSNAAEIARSQALQPGLAKSLGNMGSLQARLGDVPEAERLYNEAIAIFRELGDQENAEATLKALSDITLKRGQWVESILTQERVLTAHGQLSWWQRVQLWVIRRLRKLIGL